VLRCSIPYLLIYLFVFDDMVGSCYDIVYSAVPGSVAGSSVTVGEQDGDVEKTV